MTISENLLTLLLELVLPFVVKKSFRVRKPSTLKKSFQLEHGNVILLYRRECFTGKYTTRKIHKNYIRDPSVLFSIISHVSLSMT